MEYSGAKSIFMAFFYFTTVLAASIYMLKGRSSNGGKTSEGSTYGAELSFNRTIKPLLQLLLVISPAALFFWSSIVSEYPKSGFISILTSLLLLIFWYFYLFCFFTLTCIVYFFWFMLIRRPLRNIYVVALLFCLTATTVALPIILFMKENLFLMILFAPAAFFYIFHAFKDITTVKFVFMFLSNIVQLCLLFLLFKEIFISKHLTWYVDKYFDKYFDKWDGSSKKILIFLHLAPPVIMAITFSILGGTWIDTIFIVLPFCLLWPILFRSFFKIPKFLRSRIAKETRRKKHVVIALYCLAVTAVVLLFSSIGILTYPVLFIPIFIFIHIVIFIGIIIFYPCYLEFKRMLMLDGKPQPSVSSDDREPEEQQAGDAHGGRNSLT